MGKINYRTDDINKKLKQIDELVGSNKNLSNQIDELVNGNKNLSNQINNFNSQLDTIVQENNSYIINPLYPPEGYEGISENSEDNKNALEILLNDFKNITLPKGKFYILQRVFIYILKL